MMPPLYRIIEIIVYSLLNFLPYIIIALYPFRKHFRFSKQTTYFLAFLVTLVQIGIGLCAAFAKDEYMGFMSLMSTVLYFSFYFVSVKAHFGKTLFTLLMLSNFANLIVMLSKCIEGMIFPSFALESYRWTMSLMMFFVEIVILVPLFIYIKKTYAFAFEKETGQSIWRLLWLVPATFYIIWYYHLYSSQLSSLEIALQLSNSIFLIIINLGELLIYHIVVQLLFEIDQNITLTKENHQLVMQNLQYENLKDKINEARVAKHDIRQHVSIMNGFLQKKEYDKLENYLTQYQESLPDDRTIVYCQNHAINMLLLYFGEQCKKYGIEFDTHVMIPEFIHIAESDLSVIFGNLLENAIDACQQLTDDKKIIVRARTDETSLYMTIDNSFNGVLNIDKNNQYLSTKQKGSGLGIISVSNTVNRYDGIMNIEHTSSIFKVSIMLNYK